MIWQILNREHRNKLSTEVSSDDDTEPFSAIGHSTTPLPDGRLLTFAGWNGSATSSRLHIYSPESGRWSEVYSELEDSDFFGLRTEGPGWPRPRAYHSACLFSRSDSDWRIVFYGGGDNSDVYGNVFQLSNEPKTVRDPKDLDLIEKVSSSDSAQQRYEAKSRMGKKSSKSCIMKWTFIDFESDTSENFHHPGIRPQDRMQVHARVIPAGILMQCILILAMHAQHSATVTSENTLLILGGVGRGGRRFLDLWELHTDTWEWREIRIRGWGPASGHSATLWSPGLNHNAAVFYREIQTSKEAAKSKKSASRIPDHRWGL
jgi:hypothetical protein